MRAQSNSTANDSVMCSSAIQSTRRGQSTLRIGTTSSAEVLLQNGPSGSAPQGWGWTDNGWGSRGSPDLLCRATALTSSGSSSGRTEPTIDQIVLSPVTFCVVSARLAQLGHQNPAARVEVSDQSVSAATSVIRVAAAAAGRMFGTWQTISDATAAGSQALRNPDAGAAKIAPALSNPASYFEATFSADAGRAYHVWVRMRADGNSTCQRLSSSPVQRLGDVRRLTDGADRDDQFARGGFAGWLERRRRRTGGAGLTTGGAGSARTSISRRPARTPSGSSSGKTARRSIKSSSVPIRFSRRRRAGGWTIRRFFRRSASATSTNLPPTVTLTAPANGALLHRAGDHHAGGDGVRSRKPAGKGRLLQRIDAAGERHDRTLLVLVERRCGRQLQSERQRSRQRRRASGDDAVTITVQTQTQSQNQPPTVSLTAPTTGATFTAPATIALTATASDPEGRLARVDFYNGSTLLGSDTTAPFSYPGRCCGGHLQPERRCARQRWWQHELGDGLGDGHQRVGASRRPTESGHRRPGDCGQRPIQRRNLYGSRRRRGHLGHQRPVPFRLSADHRRCRHRCPRRVAAGRHPWSKAGVMIRESLTAGSRHAFAHATAGHGYSPDAARHYVGHLQRDRRRIRRPATRLGPADPPRQHFRDVSLDRRRHLDRLRLDSDHDGGDGLRRPRRHEPSTHRRPTTAVFDNSIASPTPANQPPRSR